MYWRQGRWLDSSLEGREKHDSPSSPKNLQVFHFWAFSETSGYKEDKRYQCNLPVRSIAQSFLCISNLLWLPSQDHRNRSVKFLGVEYNIFCIFLLYAIILDCLLPNLSSNYTERKNRSFMESHIQAVKIVFFSSSSQFFILNVGFFKSSCQV